MLSGEIVLQNTDVSTPPGVIVKVFTCTTFCSGEICFNIDKIGDSGGSGASRKYIRLGVHDKRRYNDANKGGLQGGSVIG